MKLVLYFQWFVITTLLAMTVWCVIDGDLEIAAIQILCGSHVVRSLNETRRELA